MDYQRTKQGFQIFNVWLVMQIIVAAQWKTLLALFAFFVGATIAVLTLFLFMGTTSIADFFSATVLSAGLIFFIVAICFIGTESSLREPVSAWKSINLARRAYLPGLFVLVPTYGFGVVITIISTSVLYLFVAMTIKMIGIVALVILVAEKPDYGKLVARVLDLFDHNIVRALVAFLPLPLLFAVLGLNVSSIDASSEPIVRLVKLITAAFVQLILLSVSAVAVYVELKRLDDAKFG